MALADWSANFDAPSGPSAPMHIDLPGDLDVMELTTLGVELDGIDITALLSLDGGDFSYRPVEPLSAGEHVVKLVRMSSEGSEQIGQWSFTIVGGEQGAGDVTTVDSSQNELAAAESWLRSSSFSADTMTEVSSRLFEDLPPDQPNHTIVSGGGDLNGEASSDRLSVTGRANYLVQSDRNLAQTGNAIDLGEYDITAAYTGDTISSKAILGHHDIGVNSFLFSNFYRRGASLKVGTSDERVHATTFAFRPTSVAGARDFTGLNDGDDRLEGVTASFKPFSNDLHGLRITGLYYDGEGDDGGFGLAGGTGTTGPDGTGYAVIADKGFFGGRLTLRGEYAMSDYDLDGAGAVEEDSSGAHSIAIEARPFDSPVFLDKTADIVVGGKYESIDTFFNSLANQGIAADRHAYSAYTNIYWGSLSAGLQILHQTNNVDDLANVPTDRLRSINFNTAYNFNPQEGSLSFLGTPYINFSGYVSDSDRMDTPVGYLPGDTNSLTDSATFGFGTSYSNWYWSGSHTVSQYEDHANNSSDTVNNLSGFNAGWTVNDRLELNGGVQVGSFRDEDFATTTYNTNVQLGASGIIVPNKVTARFDYNLNLAAGSGDTPDRHVVNSEAEWTLFAPQTNRPGLALAVRGSMEDFNGNANAIQDETNYQVFTVFRVRAPFSLSR
ncbi:MAG: hypothetical protein DHS20C02_19020 [Micavibrio sp.]|nr:MAG: hypothetical protein DHS20C02_19020 [Micavibrio sp.]